MEREFSIDEEDFDLSENSEIDIGYLENQLNQLHESDSISQENLTSNVPRTKSCKCGEEKAFFCDNCKEGICRNCFEPYHIDKGHTVCSYDILKGKVRKESSELFSKMLGTVQEVKSIISTPSSVLDKELLKARVAKRLINRISVNFFKGVSNDVEKTMMKSEKYCTLRNCYQTLTRTLNDMKINLFSDAPFEYYENFYDGKEQTTYFNVLKTIAEAKEKEEENTSVQIELKKECISQIYELLHDMIDLKITENDGNRIIKIKPPMHELVNKIVFYVPEKKLLCLISPNENHYSEKIELETSANLPVFSEIVVDDSSNIYFLGNSFKFVMNGKTLPSKNTFKFDIEKREFEKFPDLSVERTKCCCLYFNSCIYLIGGFVTYSQIRTRTCEFINLKDKNPVWKPFPSLITPRACSTACTFTDNGGENVYFYVFGGLSDPTTIEKSIERYSFENESWEKVALKNSVCYYSLFNSYAMQINMEDILIYGGMSEKKSKQKSRKVVILRTKSMCVESYRDILPLGIAREGRTSQPIFLNERIVICNALQGQIYPKYKQLISDFYVCDIGEELASKIIHLEIIDNMQ